MMLESGEAYLLLGETLSQLERIELEPGVGVHVPPGWVHRLCAVTDTVVLEASTDELDDVFRMDDDFIR
jgi:quercetin dioxygenase-like cupin family protein